MISVSSLEGRVFGPRDFRFCVEKVHEFIDATGDDRRHWVEAAPPAFVSAALFVVAPDLLGLLEGYSVLHGDQSFTWGGPLVLERDVSVTGTVARVRERGDTAFVTFQVDVTDGAGGDLASGESLFLVSESNGHATSGDDGPVAVDADGAPTGQQKAASRSDLVKYAAATRDWNPIHWDHGAAVEAGLESVVVHGLLQAAWALQAAADESAGPHPFVSARFRFKSPLPPAVAVDVAAERDGTHCNVSLSRGETTYMTARIELTDG